jgi:hypothetical protein
MSPGLALEMAGSQKIAQAKIDEVEKSGTDLDSRIQGQQERTSSQPDGLRHQPTNPLLDQ